MKTTCHLYENADKWDELQAAIQANRTRQVDIESYVVKARKRQMVKQELIAALTEVDVIAMPTGMTLGDKIDRGLYNHQRQGSSHSFTRNALEQSCQHHRLSGAFRSLWIRHGRPAAGRASTDGPTGRGAASLQSGLCL